MNRELLQNEWAGIQGRIRNAWEDLTEEDLARAAGDWDRLVGAIQARTGQVREDVERGLDALLDRIAEETRWMPPPVPESERPDPA